MGLFGGNKKVDEAGESKTYTVKPGDTLSEIAQRLNVDVLSLEQANVGITRGRPNTIYPGQVIHVPRHYNHKVVSHDKSVGVPAVHVNKGQKEVKVPTLSVSGGHKDVAIPTPRVETHKKEVTVPTWTLERHDKKVEVPVVSVHKKDVHVDVPTAAVHGHSKKVDVNTYSLGTHEKDVHYKVPAVEAQRKEHGYGSKWDANTPIPETPAEKKLHDERRLAAGNVNKNGGKFLGLFGGGDHHQKSDAQHHVEKTEHKVEKKVDEAKHAVDKKTHDKKGGFLGFGGRKDEHHHKQGGGIGSHSGEGEKDFVGLKRYGDRKDIGVEFEEKKGRKVGGGLLLVALLGAGIYFVWRAVKNHNDDEGGKGSWDQTTSTGMSKDVKTITSTNANGERVIIEATTTVKK